MKKKILSVILAAACLVTTMTGVFANEKSPKVYLNDRIIHFDDQEPVILAEEGRTFVPVRGVFEAMGAKVSWDDETKTATINSKDNITRVVITNNNKVMTVYTFTSIMGADKEEIILDAEPRIINDRTMVPLRAISEALDADIAWDETAYAISIDTIDETQNGSTGTTPAEDKRIKLSLSADKTTVKAGEEITVNVDFKKPAGKEYKLNGATAAIFYDKSKFEFVEMVPVVNGNVVSGALQASNAEFLGDSVKATYVSVDESDKVEDGAIMQFKFKALTDESAEFILSNRISTKLNEDTSLILENSVMVSDSKDLAIDTTPLKVN